MTDVQANVLALIERSGLSVNAWALAHHLTQSTIARIAAGKMDPTTAMVQTIADAVGLQAWQLVAPNFGEGLHTVVTNGAGTTRVVPVQLPPVAPHKP